MTADLLSALIGVNLALSAAILVILALRLPVRRLAGARMAYGLWLIAPLAALASFLPPLELSRPLSLAPPIRPAAQAAVKAMDTAFSQAAPGGDPALALVTFWALGALCVLALLLSRQRRAMVRLGALTREDMTHKDRRAFRAANPAAGPAVIGLISPRIVLPADFEGRFDARERDLILAHEEAHVAAGDVRVNALVCLGLCLNWFNPLVVFAAELVRADQELARDEAVVARHPGARKTYALALLKAQTGAGALPVGCYWPARSPQVLRSRILMLSRATPARAARYGAAALIGVLALAAGYGAWAVNPKEAAPRVVAAIAPLIPQTEEAAPVAAPPPARSPADLDAEFAVKVAALEAAQTAAGARQRAADAQTEVQRQQGPGLAADEVAQLTNSRPPVTAAPPPAALPPAPLRPSVIMNPDWLTRPANADILNAYPDRALRLGRDGRVTITCVAQEDGSLADCTITAESPAGFGFGAAALRLAPKYRMRPQTRDGASVSGAKVAVPVMFTPDVDPAPPPVQR